MTEDAAPVGEIIKDSAPAAKIIEDAAPVAEIRQDAVPMAESYLFASFSEYELTCICLCFIFMRKCFNILLYHDSLHEMLSSPPTQF